MDIACACYCSLCIFSTFCFGQFDNFTCKLLLAICWTEDVSLTGNRFLILCDQIRLRRPCIVLMQLDDITFYQFTLSRITYTVVMTKLKELLG